MDKKYFVRSYTPPHYWVAVSFSAFIRRVTGYQVPDDGVGSNAETVSEEREELAYAKRG